MPIYECNDYDRNGVYYQYGNRGHKYYAKNETGSLSQRKDKAYYKSLKQARAIKANGG